MENIWREIWDFHESINILLSRGRIGRRKSYLESVTENYRLLKEKVSGLKFSLHSKLISFQGFYTDIDLLLDFYRQKNMNNVVAGLTEIKYTLDHNKDLFDILVINGSVGDMTYKRGWSDIDIFVVVSEKSLKKENIARTFYVLDQINRAVFMAGDLQLHGIFVSTPLVYEFFTEKHFPIFTLSEGYVWSNKKDLVVFYERNLLQKSRELYFWNDIWRGLQERKKGKNILDRVLYIHRIFSFPFAFLQMQGKDVSKKESFDSLIRFAYSLDLDLSNPIKIVKETYSLLSMDISIWDEIVCRKMLFVGAPQKYFVLWNLFPKLFSRTWNNVITHVFEVLKYKVYPSFERMVKLVSEP